MRPFLPKAGICSASCTPGTARMRSSPVARSSGVWSSTSKLMTARSRTPASRGSGWCAATSTRSTFDRPGRRRVPKPMPLPSRRRAPGGAGSWARRWRRMAAPVGVTRSPPMPSSMVAKPSSSSAVAGAGTGSKPCAVATRPAPSGSGAQLQLAAPSPSSWAAISTAAATMSAIESTAPTSWNVTASGSMPCTRASAAASSPKMPSAWRRTAASSGAASSRARMSRQAVCAWLVLCPLDDEARARQHVVVVTQHAARHLRHRRDRVPARRLLLAARRRASPPRTCRRRHRRAGPDADVACCQPRSTPPRPAHPPWPAARNEGARVPAAGAGVYDGDGRDRGGRIGVARQRG